MLENDDNLESARGTVTQSGSSDGAQGLGWRLGLRMVDVDPSIAFGGVNVDWACFPFSSHHFCRSELAGGKPGSMAS